MPRSTDFINVAMGQLNFPYPAGTAPESFDTSALVALAAASVGITLPSTSKEQYDLCATKGTILDVDIAEYMRGALLFEAGLVKRHVAISLGNGEVIEARSQSYAVRDFDSPGRRWDVAALIPGMEY